MARRNILPLFVVALTVVVGCKKDALSSVPSNEPEKPSAGIPNSSTEPSPKREQGVPTTPDSPVTSTGNPVPSSSSTVHSKSAVNPSTPTVPKENPNASPPKPGEQVANDFKIQTQTQTIEIEGVCKLTEDDAVCWKPNGDSNEELAKELTAAIESRANSYSNGFQFKFKKKNRILVLKTTTPPMKPGQEGGSYGGGLMHQYSSGPEFAEGWTNNYSIFHGSSSTGFDQTRVERSVLTGAFNRETKTFPLRYEITKFERTPASSIVAKKGVFEVAGNTYEIVSMADKSSQPGYVQPNYGPNAVKVKYTYLTVKPIKITDPYAVVTLTPADDSGTPYGGLDANGNPISSAAANKKREEDQKKMMEAARAGKPYVGYQSIGPTYIQPMSLDPRSNAPSLTMAVSVEPSKLKKFSVSVQHRTVYVFDNVKLDKN